MTKKKSSPQTKKNTTQGKKKKVVKQQSPQTTIAYVAKSVPITSKLPGVNNQGRVIIKHTELLGTLKFPLVGGFQQIGRYRINPGSEATFNWLSRIAPVYEFYRFKSIKFIYRTRCSTATPGSVIISPDYDASEGQNYSLDERTIFSNIGTSDDSVWKDKTVTLSPSLMNKMYKAHTNMSDARFKDSKQDEKTVDAAQVFIFTESDSVGLSIGKLIVEYEVEFWGPQSPTEAPNAGGGSTYVQNNGSTLINKNSTKPLLQALNLVSVPDAISGTLLKNPHEIPGLVWPTAVFGQLVRDWEGVIQAQANGTTVDTNFHCYKSGPEGMNTVAGDPSTDTQLLADAGTADSKNAAGTMAFKTLVGNFKKGDLLKVSSGDATTLVQMATNLRGLGLL